MIEALRELPRREGILFPASEGGRVNIDNFRSREWVPALRAAGIEHRRIYEARDAEDQDGGDALGALGPENERNPAICRASWERAREDSNL